MLQLNDRNNACLDYFCCLIKFKKNYLFITAFKYYSSSWNTSYTVVFNDQKIGSHLSSSFFLAQSQSRG